MGLTETNRLSTEYGYTVQEIIDPTEKGDLRWRRSGTRWTTFKVLTYQYRIYLIRDGIVFQSQEPTQPRRFRYIFPLEPCTRGRLFEAIVFNQEEK